MYVWPWRLLLPEQWKTRLSDQTVTGGQSWSGDVQTTRTDGGGLWLSDHIGIPLFHLETLLCLEAWNTELDAGATQFILPCCKLYTAPRPLGPTMDASSACCA